MNIEKIKLSMGKAFGGGDLEVVGYRFTSGAGPSTYLQGGTHGGEITYPIFKNIYSHLQNNPFVGTITLVPIANPISWMQRLYFYTAGKFSMYDGKDWNWFFPGKKDGTTAERFAHMIFQEARKHEFVVDLHTSRWSKPFLIIGDEKYLPMAKAMGITHTYLYDLDEVRKRKGITPLGGALDEVGVEGFSIECGSHDSMDIQNSEHCSKTLLKLLSLRGHFAYEHDLQPGVYYTGLTTYNAPITGFVEYVHNFWDKVKEGEVLYKIYSSDDLESVVEVAAKEDCVVAKHQPTHTALVGDQVVQTIPLSTIHQYK